LNNVKFIINLTRVAIDRIISEIRKIRKIKMMITMMT